MASIFSKIITGEIPCYKIAETDDYLAFLDIFPLKRGHTLCIPKIEVDYIFDLEDDVLTGLALFSKKVAKAVGKAVTCERVGVAVIGLEVPHTHVHLVPINGIADINFSSPKLKLSSEDLATIAAEIRSFL